jgi:hypothetical protein
MLAVPQNMGFLACALPIESYSLCPESGLLLPRVGIIVAQSRDYCCPESGLLLPTLFLRSSHLGLLQGLPWLLQDYADLIRSIRSIASRLA